MEPDRQSESRLEPGSQRFFNHKLAEPLAYLRGLMGPENESEGAESAGAPMEGLSAGSAQSVLKVLERKVGRLPVLDLPQPPEEAPRPEDLVDLSEKRYLIEGEIASGGMGRILNVYDQDIRRRVAMKVLHRGSRDAHTIGRFFEEAQATGQLEHPNIAPIYDLGIDEQHGVFFTMKLVRGRNLQEVIRDLAVGRHETRKRFTLTRMLQILQQVAMGVHYAHVRGVIHRDLKPENIMVGDFGETLVMDWGLAKITVKEVDRDSYEEPVDSQRRTSGHKTQDGTVSGTIAYMSPEQAKGWVDEIDERTDIFGLGAILYEILTFQAPFSHDDQQEILALAGAGEVVAPRQRAPRNVIPESLEEICLQALAADKADRYPDAMAFHEALQVFLDGSLEAERRRKEATVLTRQAQERAREYRRLAELESRMRKQAVESLAGLKPHDSDELKATGWAVEDSANQIRQQRIQAFNESTAFLHSAIHVDENHAAAKETLAGLYWERFEEAERDGNSDDMIIYRGLVERYHEGKFARLLAGIGTVTIDTDPVGATVKVVRMVERTRRLIEEPLDGAGGETPLRLELPIGYYILCVEKPGYRTTRYPLLLERCERHQAKVRLYREEAIPEGFVYMPAGECSVGGDPDAPGSLPLSRRYVGDLFVARYPVTFREYCRFLDALAKNSDPSLEELLPSTEAEGTCVRRSNAGYFEPDPEKLDLDSHTRARYGEGFEWDLPVIAVSWHAAARYARWLSERLGKNVRLLRDLEWEKASRGVARSLHPWGDRFDWSFCKGGLSRPERAQPEPVGVFGGDESVYRIRDLSGCVREWCEDWFLEKKYRLTRGGGWYSIHSGAFRGAYRLGTNPAIKSSLIGFRVAIEP